MADEPRYPDEIRIPISFTVPWSGKLTREGKPWPRDKHGRDWPSRRGRPVFPINELPKGFAPGTSDIYRAAAAAERRGSLTVTAEAPLLPSTLVRVFVAGEETVILLAELAGFLVSLEIAVPVALFIGAALYTFQNSPVVQRWARQLAGLPPDLETFPQAEPLPSLPPMTDPPDLPRHTGDPATVRLPALPLPPPDVRLPNVLPGPAIIQPGPTILESRGRNTGLQGDARTNTDRARDAARRADAPVTQQLADGEWRAHHLIPLEAVRSGNAVVEAALRAGWKTDEESNIVALPNSAGAREKLREAGIDRPLDDSGHPQWNDGVIAELEEITGLLDIDFGEENSSLL